MATEPDKPGTVPPTEPLDLDHLVDYGNGAVVSRTLMKNKAGTLT